MDVVRINVAWIMYMCDICSLFIFYSHPAYPLTYFPWYARTQLHSSFLSLHAGS